MEKNMNICVIPAKTNSLRISNKNYIEIEFQNRKIPLMNLTFQEIFKQKSLFDEIYISINAEYNFLCSKYKWFSSLLKKYNIKFFRRNDKNAKDDKQMIDVVLEVLNKINIKKGVCTILSPLSILIKNQDVCQSINLIKNKNYDCVFTVIKNSSTLEKILIKKENKFIYKYKKYAEVDSKKCNEFYTHTGEFFTCRIEKLLKNKKIITDNNFGIVKDEMQVQDIDTFDDLKKACIKYCQLSSFENRKFF